MAEEKDKSTEEVAEEESEESGAKKKETKKRGLPKLVIIIGAVVLLGALGGGGFFFYTQMQPAEASEEEEESSREEIEETNIYFSGFQTNIVNLAVSDEYEFVYLKYRFELEVESNAVTSEIVTKLPRLTSKAAGVMSNRNWNEICTPQGRERLARDCLRAINDELTTGQCIGLYFSTFVAQ